MLNVGYQKWNHKIDTYTKASGKVPKKLAKNFEFMIHKSYWINDHLIFHFNVYCKLIQEIVSHNDILLVVLSTLIESNQKYATVLLWWLGASEVNLKGHIMH